MSGIYIPGMEMPKSCNECRFFADAWCYAFEADDWRNAYYKPPEGERRDNCPLIPVPDHGDLIDRDALIDDMANMIPWAIESPEEIAMVDGLSEGYEAVKAAPIIIPASPADKGEEE